MSDPTESAVIIPIGPAEDLVAEHRRDLDLASSWGVPAHVTVVYPFVPPSQLDSLVINRLAAVIGAVPSFDCTFSRCGWFGDEVLWLAPDPDQAFRDITIAVTKEFPDYPPYGGAFKDVVPHLTIGELRRGTVAQLRAAEADVARRLPFSARIDHALLIAGTSGPNSWHRVAMLPLGVDTD